ncbi:hypothetical protein IT575_04060 [bacterium]|nr:hypothetical protein [bacterium]
MRFSGISRLHFFLGWVSLWLGMEFLLLGEFLLRVPDPPGMYFIEAGLAILAPFGALALGDHEAVRIYREVWNGLGERLLSTVLIERDAVSRLRADLRQHWLLWFYAPREARSLSGQLRQVAVWYQALALPTDSPFGRRFGFIMLSRLAMLLALPAFIALGASVMGAGLRQPTPFALLICALLLGVIGYDRLLMAARGQALGDFFAAWKASRERPLERDMQFEQDDEDEATAVA